MACTGLGVISCQQQTYRHLHHEVVRTDKTVPLVERLAQISTAVTQVCAQWNPSQAVIERTFINVNLASSHALGQARGAALAALGLAGIVVMEIAPNTVKRQVTGNSLADKSEVAQMVKALLGLEASMRMPRDASDALAIALSFGINRKTKLRLARRRRSYYR